VVSRSRKRSVGRRLVCPLFSSSGPSSIRSFPPRPVVRFQWVVMVVVAFRMWRTWTATPFAPLFSFFVVRHFPLLSHHCGPARSARDGQIRCSWEGGQLVRRWVRRSCFGRFLFQRFFSPLLALLMGVVNVIAREPGSSLPVSFYFLHPFNLFLGRSHAHHDDSISLRSAQDVNQSHGSRLMLIFPPFLFFPPWTPFSFFVDGDNPRLKGYGGTYPRPVSPSVPFLSFLLGILPFHTPVPWMSSTR